MDLSDLQRAKEQKAVLDSEMVYEGRIITAVRQIYRWPDEDPHVVDLVLHPGAVAILPIMADGRLLLIRQWRSAVGEILIEIPAGTLEKRENIDVCAQRELQEETGFLANRLTQLGSVYTAPGFCSEKLYLYLARDLEKAPLPPDAHEAIDLYPVTLEHALMSIEKGLIVDAKTIVAILRYAREKLQ